MKAEKDGFRYGDDEPFVPTDHFEEGGIELDRNGEAIYYMAPSWSQDNFYDNFVELDHIGLVGSHLVVMFQKTESKTTDTGSIFMRLVDAVRFIPLCMN